MIKKLLLFFCLLPAFAGYAAHLVGGEITYKCVGNHNYEVTLIVYRDCFSSGAEFDPLASITIYDGGNNSLVQDFDIPILSSNKLPVEAPTNCTTLPPTVCTERAVYRFTTHLPPRAGGYIIAHQRCCRNATIVNVPNPDDWGSTYHATIPGNDTGCNSSPVFNDTPPVVLCLDQPLQLDMSASDADGDSLYYGLCNPLHGGGKNSTSTGFDSPKPDMAAPPPYSPVFYAPGFTPQNPITSANPVMAINPHTGILSGRPTAVGQYVFAICVSEYRSGVLISTVRRDFRFNVSDACQATISQMETQLMNPSTLCDGPQLNFQNLSRFATSYFWDFGDPLTNGDTSRLKNPTYIYPDTGSYTVTLIANPGDVCADTSYYTFKLNFPLSISTTVTGDVCFDKQSFIFNLTGDFSTNAKYFWDFGGATDQGANSTEANPKNVNYIEPGSYPISVTVEDFGCSKQIFDTVEVYADLKLQHYVPALNICVSEPVYFRDSSITDTRIDPYHYWDFGDGTASNEPSPVHTYTEPGIYTIEHSVQTLTGCKDSVFERFINQIQVYPNPVSQLDIYPTTVSIFDPTVNLTNYSENYDLTRTYLPDGEVLETFDMQTITFKDTGTFALKHVAMNDFGCRDSSIYLVTVEVPLNIYIPNSFTPNGDGINDIFTLEVTGSEKFSIRIFNRWGEMVYESFDPKEGWNGRILNYFEPAPEGLYTYQVVVRTIKHARDIKKHGTITLIR
ncbi:MAG TPA: hypothetical protein DCG19_07420 [Cryomorphaceae bacterium]|nr:hypothetical protein [Cryomorphaceae bacterium]